MRLGDFEIADSECCYLVAVVDFVLVAFDALVVVVVFLSEKGGLVVVLFESAEGESSRVE